ncbi:aminodeoxychorismate synthase component I [Roseibium sediminicola]|uniref:Probable branched-chain-amino-acid aminotransferase n=1 Tax=Roseibium sediminicola TaxID=2933272 RepID=A0ABT0GXI3_9HYPH|nr:aminodeoxychorismate synthase component I [Roseibium sp. CAU 1639]MCK7614146.1 aminodeoxychorismate synthase component I [Roseibium sp. CAU 1639]
MSERVFQPGSVLLLDLLKQPEALLFQKPREIVTCTRLDDVAACLTRLEAAQAEGLYAAGYLAYELGFAFEEKLRRRFRETGEPLLWFGLYGAPERLSPDAARALLSDAAGDGVAVTGPLDFDMDRSAYDAAFGEVRDHLAKGDIYQVNLTMRARFGHEGAPERLFLDLLRRQPVEFAAFMRLEDRTVLSLSPELFLERRGTRLTTRPMKGTAPRGRYPSEDGRLSRELASDPKQRSENIMIVDLMRNDLSRIAETGSVQVTSLCEVERYQSLHQMTSTVEATVPADQGFATVIENLFPCGSITGAPKLSAMQIAHDLETGPRGVYTGSIGYLAPGGDFRFNVAIRTLVLRRDGSGEAGAGSGVVFDSGAAPEYDECALKLKFLSEAVPEFELIETMAHDPVDGYLLLDRHLRRLQQSADYFGFSFDEDAIRSALCNAAATFTGAQRVRLLLNAEGKVSVTATDLGPVDRTTVFNLVMASETTHSGDRFLYHKTTNRAFYDDTRMRYQAETGCQEVLFENENGFLTEGSYMTLFLKKDGRLLTPALRHGLLPGTFRSGLLERGLAVEADLTQDDLLTADEILVGNSVRGLVRARLISNRQGAAGHTVGDDTLLVKRQAG